MAANFTTTDRSGRASVEADDAHFNWSTAAGRSGLITLIALVAGLVAAYWRVLVDTAAVWDQPQYSHGWIVPLIGLYLMWSRRPNATDKQHPLILDLGVIRIDFTLVGGAALAGSAAYAGNLLGLPFLQAFSIALLCASLVAWTVIDQPFATLSEAWPFDLEDYGERTLLGCSAVASLLIAAVYSGFVPAAYHMPLMLLALLLYGGSLLGVSLASRSGPLLRTGSETLAATVTVIGASLAWMRATQLDMMPLMRIGFIVSLLGAFALVGGRRLMRWASPAVVFIVFMFPFPSVVEHTLLPKLQKVAAYASEKVLQIVSMPVYREGNTLTIEGLSEAQRLEVAEACSGLRMSTIFGAMTVAMVFLIRRPWWDKFTILLSAIPVALLVNVIRIVVTAVLYYAVPDNAELKKFIHDYAGFAMMPLAMGILWLELTILSNLTVEEDGVDYQSGGRNLAPGI